MLVTDYGYRWYRLAPQWVRYWQVRLCSSAETPLCWGVSHILRRSVPMAQESSEVWFFSHLLGFLNGSFTFTGRSSIIRWPDNQLQSIGLCKIQKFLRGILSSIVWQKCIWCAITGKVRLCDWDDIGSSGSDVFIQPPPGLLCWENAVCWAGGYEFDFRMDQHAGSWNNWGESAVFIMTSTNGYTY